MTMNCEDGKREDDNVEWLNGNARCDIGRMSTDYVTAIKLTNFCFGKFLVFFLLSFFFLSY